MSKYKTTEKPWGREELIEHNDKYVMKKLVMNKGHACSLQYHEYKHETMYILSGKLKITFGNSEEELEEKILNPDDSIVIPVGVIHRAEALEDSVYLESSTPELDDVIRLKDDYNRT